MLLNCHGKKEIQEAFDLLEVESLKSYCLMHLDEIDDAREALEKCLKICPNHAPSNRRLASLYEKVKIALFRKEILKSHSACIKKWD